MEPTGEQRSALSAVTGRVSLLTFLAPRDEAGGEAYLEASAAAVGPAGGTRDLTLDLDLVLTGEPLPYALATLDRFPDGARAMRAHEALEAERAACLTGLHSLRVKQNRLVPTLTRALSVLAPLLRRLGDYDESRPIDVERVLSPPSIHPAPERIAELGTRDQDEPFYTLILNKFRDRAGDAAEIQTQILRPSGRSVLALGGTVAATGDAQGTFVGAPGAPLSDAWDDMSLAYWPSRSMFRTYLANASADVADARKRYLDRVINVACARRPGP